jgi:hypothetical protein
LGCSASATTPSMLSAMTSAGEKRKDCETGGVEGAARAELQEDEQL